MRQHLKCSVLCPQQPSVLGQMNTWQCFLLTAHVVDQPWYLNYHLLLVHLLLLLAKMKNVSSIKSPKRKKRNIHSSIWQYSFMAGSQLTDCLNHFLPEHVAEHWALWHLSASRKTREILLALQLSFCGLMTLELDVRGEAWLSERECKWKTLV